MTEKLMEGMKWELEQTKQTKLSYQLGKKEQAIQQQVCTSHVQ